MAQWPPRPQYPQQRQQYPQYQYQNQGETDWKLTGVQWVQPGEGRYLKPGFVKQQPSYNYPNTNYQNQYYNQPNYNYRRGYNNYGYDRKIDTSYLKPVSN